MKGLDSQFSLFHFPFMVILWACMPHDYCSTTDYVSSHWLQLILGSSLSNSFPILNNGYDSDLWQNVYFPPGIIMISLGYMFRSLQNVLSLETIKQIYFAYIYSGLNYGIIFWGNSPHSRAILITQKRIIRIIMKANTRISCRMLFRKLGILFFYSQYIYAALMFVVRHLELFPINL